MTGYKVATQALRDMATKLTDAGAQWKAADTAINSGPAALGEHDLGLLGEWAGFVGVYNTARGQASTVLRQGEQALTMAGTTLGAVATNYEHKDATYYRMFGYMAAGR